MTDPRPQPRGMGDDSGLQAQKGGMGSAASIGPMGAAAPLGVMTDQERQMILGLQALGQYAKGGKVK